MSALRSAPVGAILLSLLAALLLAVLGPAQDADSAAPRVSPALAVAPAATMPGGSVLVEGRGWPAGTRVIFSLGGANTGASGRYGAATADARGRVTMRFRPSALTSGVPLTPGRITLLAHNADGSLKATAPFTVTR